VNRHTPPPFWLVAHPLRVGPAGDVVLGQQIWSIAGRIGFTEQQNVGEAIEKLNAEFVIAACNAHQRLVDVAANLVELVRRLEIEEADATDPIAALARAAREALVQAGRNEYSRSESRGSEE
jgi:hypothetical protein